MEACELALAPEVPADDIASRRAGIRVAGDGTASSATCALDDRSVPVRMPLDGSSVIDPLKPIRRSMNSALSAPLCWRYARASVSVPFGARMRASIPVESTATISGSRTEPHVAGAALSTR
jgi:hypothetical protein